MNDFEKQAEELLSLLDAYRAGEPLPQDLESVKFLLKEVYDSGYADGLNKALELVRVE